MKIDKQEVVFSKDRQWKTYVDYKGSRGDNWKNVDTLLLAKPSDINGYPIRLINDKQKTIGVQITGSNPASALRIRRSAKT